MTQVPRIINRPVQVRADPLGRPRGFVFRGRHRVCEVLEVWEEIGEWWESPMERTVYRVRAGGGGLFELEFRRPEERWYLYKAYD